jgi:drug/metabolite transporter superfamily protein YnfA
MTLSKTAPFFFSSDKYDVIGAFAALFGDRIVYHTPR